MHMEDEKRAHGDRFIDIAHTLRPAGRVLSSAHVGWYHVVLTQPPERRADTMTGLTASQPLPQALEPTREKRARGDRFIDLGPA